MRPKDVVREFVSAFNAKDADALAELYSDNAINHQVAEEPVEGKRTSGRCSDRLSTL